MVVLVEDNLSFGAKIETLFKQNDIPIEVWSDYTNLMDRLSKVRPTVILLDIKIGKDPEAGIKALKEIKEKHPGIKAIVLTRHLEYVTKAFRYRADGYLQKEEITFSIEYIKQVIQDAKSGKIPMTDDVKRAVIQNFQPYDQEKINLLNDRELQIIFLAAHDKNIPQIAEILALTPATVETYVRNLKGKLDCKTMQGVVGRAFYHRILNPDDLAS